MYLEATDLVCRAAVAMLVSVLCARLCTCCAKEILHLAIKGACACGGAQRSLNSSQQQLHVFEDTKRRGKKALHGVGAVGRVMPASLSPCCQPERFHTICLILVPC